MCKVLSVSKSAYYSWKNTSVINLQKIQDEKLLIEKIKSIFVKSKCAYGTRRIRKALNKDNIIISRRRVGKLMKKAKLYCKTKRKFRVTTDSKHGLPIAPNLLGRNFYSKASNKAWCGDITYIPTKEGWLYLAVVIDLYSRKIVGWSMDKNMKTNLVNDALSMAIWSRKPGKGLIWHTDRGSQYASDAHRLLLDQHDIKQSMSRKGNCWDNAVSESFFHSLKTELVHHEKYKTREEARLSILEYIEIFYNRVRLHSYNDYMSPVEFENHRKII